MDKSYFDNHKIKSKFSYGSRVYKSNGPDSDYDYIVVCEQSERKIDSVEIDGDNYTLYSEDGFKEEILNHEISVLECLFLTPDLFISSISFDFSIDIQKLRHAISQKSSNSYVKAKKKLIDNEIYIAQKSLYHSLRIIEFGIQLAKHGRIVDYTLANHYLNDIKELPSDWSVWHAKYQPIHNSLMTEFRKLAPKIK